MTDGARQLIDEASHTLTKRFEGHLGTLDAILANYGDFGITASCIALFTPKIQFEGGVPVAYFAGSKESIPIDCFHVDLLHHSQAEGKNPKVLKCIGSGLALFWSNVLKENNLPGKFEYDESSGFDVVYSI